MVAWEGGGMMKRLLLTILILLSCAVLVRCWREGVLS